MVDRPRSTTTGASARRCSPPASTRSSPSTTSRRRAGSRPKGGWTEPAHRRPLRRLLRAARRRARRRCSRRACTINEPNIVSTMGHLAGVFPPGLRDAELRRRVNGVFVDAHRKAVDAIRAAGAGRAGRAHAVDDRLPGRRRRRVPSATGSATGMEDEFLEAHRGRRLRRRADLHPRPGRARRRARQRGGRRRSCPWATSSGPEALAGHDPPGVGGHRRRGADRRHRERHRHRRRRAADPLRAGRRSRACSTASTRASTCAATRTGRCSTTSSGPSATGPASASSRSTAPPSSARRSPAPPGSARWRERNDVAVMDAALRAAAEAARGFMPPDEGSALHDAAAAVPPAWPGRSSRSARTAASRRCTSARRPRSARPGAVLGRPPPRVGGEPARLGVARARPRRPRRRAHGHAAPVPAHGVRRRARGRRDRGRGRRRRSSPPTGPRRSRSCSSTAATASSRRAPTTPAGRRTSCRAACWPSTTCSPTPPTAAARPYEEIYLPALRVRPLRGGVGHRLPPRPPPPADAFSHLIAPLGANQVRKPSSRRRRR